MPDAQTVMRRLGIFLLASLLGLIVLFISYLPYVRSIENYRNQISGVVFFFLLPWMLFLLIWYVIVYHVRFLHIGYQKNIIPFLLASALFGVGVLPLFGFESADRRLHLWDLMTYLSFLLSLKFVLLLENRKNKSRSGNPFDI